MRLAGSLDGICKGSAVRSRRLDCTLKGHFWLSSNEIIILSGSLGGSALIRI